MRFGKGVVHGLQHTGVTVTDFEAAVKWYHDTLGFLLVSELWIDDEKARSLAPLYGRDDLQIRLGFMRSQSGVVLEIFEFDPAEPPEPIPWNRNGYTHIALSVRNVRAVMDELERRGVEFLLPEPEFAGGAHWNFFRDPDGNLIEIIDFHANRLPLHYLGGIVGRIFKRGKWERYYR